MNFEELYLQAPAMDFNKFLIFLKVQVPKRLFYVFFR